MARLNVLNREIAVHVFRDDDFICITDMARYKDAERTDYIIQNWLRNRNTIEFLGIWEQLNNPNFKPIEFDGFRRQARLNSLALTAKRWTGDDKRGGVNIQVGTAGPTRWWTFSATTA
ncbi:MAG: KilA-N domain-containing protein [Chloroflexi bacterium]|nr:KilA-N domain-containing protein [Chloroflexota bacterium]